jgi:hypothetical protein
LRQTRVVSHVFETLIARTDKREAQMEALELRIYELARIFMELAAELRVKRGQWSLPRGWDS